MGVSILIGTRNRAAQLGHTLLSLEQYQSGIEHGSIQIVIVDDASTDETRDVVLAAQKKSNVTFSYTRTMRQGGYLRNPSPVFNRGHQLCAHPVVIEQGGEVVHVNNVVGELLRLCSPGVVALARVYNGTVQELGQLRARLREEAYVFPPDVMPKPVTDGNEIGVVRDKFGWQIYCGVERPVPFLFCGAIHKQDFDSVGGYNESLPNCNDQDLAERLLARGVRFVWSGRAIAWHLKHPKV